MKRGKPMKRSPLKRGDSKLRQKTPLNKRSNKTEDKYITRREIVKEMLSVNKECKACVIFHVHDNPNTNYGVVRCNRTQDIHELVNRSQGGSILDSANLIAICRKCHSRVTTNPKEAEILGLHLESWCNNEEGFKEAERVRHCWLNGKQTKPSWLK